VSFNHRVSCTGCPRFWRESCRDCAEETAERHRQQTGHRVELSITHDGVSMWQLQQMTRQASMRLYGRRGW